MRPSTPSLKPLKVVEEKIQFLFAKSSVGRPSSPRKSQHGETSDQRDDPQEHGHIIPDQNNPFMKVDFPRWEEGDSIEWISSMAHYFRFYQTVDATRVKIVVTLRDMLFSVSIGLSTPMKDSLGSDSRKDY
ncbi:hypothetical protein GW17_00057553 [Ensete ventricosum]|nr:hypothetical protein GW17_00057553 [Ensete ventricosum]RZR84166.1 hypothetical protein BHM03_00010932 [Ensete ventricosum]